MKLLYITNGINGAGGLERVLSVKASILAENYGYEVHILKLNEENTNSFYSFSLQIKFHNIQIFGNTIQYVMKYINNIRNKVNEIQPDVISVCDDGLKGFFVPSILGKKYPVIYERHVSKLIELSDNISFLKKVIIKGKFLLMNILAKDFNRFVVLTDGNKNEWNVKNIEVISNPLPFFQEKTSNLENKKVIAVGKQSYQKSYDRLLQSWSLLGKEFSDWELHIYGKKDPEQKLEELAEHLGIREQVFFHNPQKNIQEKYLESSIFVLTSRFEGFGMVIIEAMSCGLPCISFDCKYGPSDIIKNNEDGFLVENGNIEKFSEKLEILMNDANLRINMGHTARINVQSYLPSEIVEKWDFLFRNIMR